MQYSVPQFVDVEDKIIGPLTLKQFLIMVFGGLILFSFWSILGVSIFFFVLALPVAGLFVGLAFGKFNGRPIISNITGFVRFYFTSRERIFRRSADTAAIIKKKPPIKEQIGEHEISTEEKTSRLHKLAYLLDQKAAEEERLIHSGKLPKKWINEI